MSKEFYNTVLSELGNEFDLTDWVMMDEALSMEDYVCDIDVDHHRWYDSMIRIVRLKSGLLVGIDSYHVTGDNSIHDMDIVYKKKSVDSIYEIESDQVMSTRYSIKKGE